MANVKQFLKWWELLSLNFRLKEKHDSNKTRLCVCVGVSVSGAREAKFSALMMLFLQT